MAMTSLSEKFRLAGKNWCDLNAAASLLEETKTAVLNQMMTKLGDIPVTHAERVVKSSDDWLEFVSRMVEARKAANLAKIEIKWIEMRFSERQSAEATARTEARL